MKFLIDQIKLKLLLEQKRDHFKSSVQGIDMLITDIIYIVSLMCCDFKSVWGINEYVIKTLAWVFAIVLLLYSLYKIYWSSKNKYNHTDLYHDIENINEVLHRFSIVAMKDTFHEFSNKYLLYYDKAWKCWFFFSFKTAESENEKFIKQRLSNTLKIDLNDIKLEYITDRLQPKFSKKDQVNKVYQHSLYLGKILNFSDEMKKKEFVIDNVKYKWMSIDEMEADQTIMEINHDVVTYVKEKIS